MARYKASVLEKVAALVDQIEQSNEEAEAAAQEQTKPGTSPIADSEALAQTIDRLNEQLATELGKNKQLKKKLDKLEKEHLPKLRQYEEQERKLDGRSSYSKTDPDATFMRMKDDHMKNGQLKPGYNVQIGTEDQFIVNYTIHQSTVDAPVFVEHMDNTKSLLAGIDQSMPQRIGGDAGYGYEQNYDYLEAEGLGNYLKYPGFFQEQQKISAKPIFGCQPILQPGTRLLYLSHGPAFKLLVYGQRAKRKAAIRLLTGFIVPADAMGAPCREPMLQSQAKSAHHSNESKPKSTSATGPDNLWSLRGIRMRKSEEWMWNRFSVISKPAAASDVLCCDP
ncbi:MAG: transposase [Saprospiraceae bacterium]